MALDINPLGNTLHLQQLERSAAKQGAYERAESMDIRMASERIGSSAGWISNLKDLLRRPSFAN